MSCNNLSQCFISAKKSYPEICFCHSVIFSIKNLNPFKPKMYLNFLQSRLRDLSFKLIKLNWMQPNCKDKKQLISEKLINWEIFFLSIQKMILKMTLLRVPICCLQQRANLFSWFQKFTKFLASFILISSALFHASHVNQTLVES